MRAHERCQERQQAGGEQRLRRLRGARASGISVKSTISTRAGGTAGRTNGNSAVASARAAMCCEERAGGGEFSRGFGEGARGCAPGGGQVPAPRPREPARGVKVHTAAAPNRYRWRCRREAHFLLGRSQGSRTSAAGRALVATTRRSVLQLRLRAGGA